VDKAAKPEPLRTLRQAHEALARSRPHLKAPLREWIAYYQRSAALYTEIAEIDRGHHHEALHMAEQAQESVKEIEEQIPPATARTCVIMRSDGVVVSRCECGRRDREAWAAQGVDAGARGVGA
jgi:hypothetical protein